MRGSRETKSATLVAYAYTLGGRVTWPAMKCAFAAIRSRCIELTAATAHIPIQTPKKPTVSAVSAKHSKNVELLTVSHVGKGCVNASGAARCSARGSRENQKRYARDGRPEQSGSMEPAGRQGSRIFEFQGIYDPTRAIGRKFTGRHYAMHMRVKFEFLTPGVQHAEEANFSAKMLGIAGNFQKCFCTGAEQEIVDNLLILKSQWG